MLFNRKIVFRWLQLWHVLHEGHKFLIVETLLWGVDCWSILFRTISLRRWLLHIYLMKSCVSYLQHWWLFKIKNLHFILSKVHISLTTNFLTLFFFIYDWLCTCGCIFYSRSWIFVPLVTTFSCSNLLLSICFYSFSCYLSIDSLLYQSILVEEDPLVPVCFYDLPGWKNLL